MRIMEMSQAVEEFYNRCHSPSTGRFCGGSGPSGSGMTKQTAAIRDTIRNKGYKVKSSAPKAGSKSAVRGTNPPTRKARQDKINKELSRSSAEILKRVRAKQTLDKNYGFSKTGEKKTGQSGGIGGGSAGKRSTSTPATKAPRVRHNVAPTKDGSQPLGRKFKITGNKVKDHLDMLQLDRGSPERQAASKAWNKRYG